MIFGIDGGGTSTRLVICSNDGKILAQHCGKSSNIYSVGADQAFTNIENLIKEACAFNKLSLSALQYGCIGSAGLQRKPEYEAFTTFFTKLLPQAKVRLCTDAEILLVGGLASLEGYALICGTGSIAMARNAQGELYRAGGMGYMLGDEGSALWIAYEAIKRSLKSIEHRDLPSKLLPKFLDFFALQQASDFIPMVHRAFDKASIAKAATLVFEAQKKNDALACDIIEQASKELALLVQSVVLQAKLPNGKLILGGGVFENNSEFLELCSAEIANIKNAPTIIPLQQKAEFGALMLAKEQIK